MRVCDSRVVSPVPATTGRVKIYLIIHFVPADTVEGWISLCMAAADILGRRLILNQKREKREK